MKKKSIFCLLLALALALCACAPGSETLQGSEPFSEASSKPTEPSAEATAPSTKETEPSTEPTNPPTEPTEPPVSPEPVPGEKTLRNLLATALQPVGKTLYVWGGGWNEADDGAGVEAVSIGLAPAWEAFFQSQDGSYDYEEHRYQIHDGLDCSGYLGWVLYNVMNTESGGEGFVQSSTGFAKNLADRGFGTYTEAAQVTDYRAGDILSQKGHVWLVLGQCQDGSVLFVHCSPPALSICGTLGEKDEETMASRLAQRYIAQCFPELAAKFDTHARPASSYLPVANQFRWNDTLADPQGLGNLPVEELLQVLLPTGE